MIKYLKIKILIIHKIITIEYKIINNMKLIFQYNNLFINLKKINNLNKSN